MARRAWPVLTILCLIATVAPARGQTPYHLHTETSLVHGDAKQLKTAGPETGVVVLQSPNLKNQTVNPSDFHIAYFETQANVPGLTGYFPANSVITFSLVMRKTAAYGTFRPRAFLFLNNYCCSDGVGMCATTGPGDPPPAAPDLTTSFARYTLQCTLSSAVVITASDRFFLDVAVNVAGAPGNHNIYCELEIEGTSSTDSYVTIPNPAALPTITSLSVMSGPVNSIVTISGSNFGSTLGTVTFYNNKPATVTNWTSGSIATSVPVGATTGVVKVTASGVNATCPGNNCTFTVVPAPSLTSLTPSTGHWTDAITIAGANFLNQQGGSTVSFHGTLASPTAWSNSSITVPVPVNTTSGDVVVTVSGQPSNGLPFVAIPPPTLTSRSPTAAHRGEPVTITGTNFGASQGANTIKFNTVTAAVTTWSDASIVATVPATATTGNIVVTVSNQASNGLPFTVIVPGTMAGTITRATGGSGISGANVQAVQTGVVKGSATTAANGTYTIANLDPASYDVRVFATGFSPELRTAQPVTSETTATVNMAMFVPGSVSGRVTQADGVSPLSGAAVTVFSGPSQKGSTNTNGTGDYTIANLHPGAFTVQAADVGYSTSEQGASVAENATTTKNFSLQGAASGPVQYEYDALGRLVQVTNPEGESAIYRYDAVGNVTAIERPGGASVAISGFTPINGLVGATVTIYGSGFSTTPAQNTVTFDAVAATVTNATTTHITATVPAGATTGAIAVATPTGSAASSTAFTVLSTSGVPTISGFTPGTVAAGTTLTVNGSNFETVAGNNNLQVNISPAQVSAATGSAVQTIVPPSATTGHVSVATPNGIAVSSDYLWVAPPPFLAADLESTGTLPFATDTSLSVSAANKVALRVFEGTEGHRASINVTSLSANVNVYVFDAFGNLVAWPLISVGGLVEPVDLRSTAIYSVVFDPSTTNATTGTLRLYDVPPDFASAISFATAVDVQTTVPGQNGRLTFAGTAGHRLSVTQIGGYNCFTGTTSILTPEGGTVASTCGGSFLDRTNPLPSTGTYTVLVDPSGAGYGSTTVTVYDVPDDASNSTTIGGAGVPLSMNTPGQNGAVTFSGSAQQVVSIHVTGSSVPRGTVTLMTEGGQQVGSTPWLGTGNFNLSNQTLPTTGNYIIVFDPYDSYTGTLTVSVTSP